MTDDELQNAIRRALAEHRTELDTDAAWNRLRDRISASGSLRPGARFRLAMLLAAAAVIVAVGITMSRVSPERSSRPIELATAGAERRTVVLDDGSRVTLTPHTTLRYRREGANRVVDLSGQASFTVVHDANRPFVVRFAGAQAVDIGTEFVVRSFPGDNASVVAVISGEVALRMNAAELRLEAGQAGRVVPDGTLERADARWVLAWSEGRLLFEDQPFGTIARELGRWFDIDIRVNDPALERRHVSAVYNAPTLDGVLDALALATHSRHSRDGRVVTFTPLP
jgi:transmembrane sensor